MEYPGNLFVVAAPSGAGKSSLVKALLELDAKLAVSISRPLDALNRLQLRKLDLHPAFSSFVGNPAPRIAAAAIVEMFQLVNFITWQCA